ncbi:MAG: hypothetical protein QF890_07525 [Myxococcota bacterium]|nr:hypothetical protein [bacterium]MDP7075351.1 hypothetical protein [Myxococcota bacterium]MDP7298507.1 hypothetical protein [Myxococcota bacterium]MDP7432407.1 hypothetical protein [Myxococcota bacterium]
MLTFIDGRAATLYRDETVADYHTLIEAGPGWRELLRKHRIGAVLVERPSPLAQALVREDPPWVRVDSDPRSFLMLPPWREDLVPIGELLGDSADFHLSRAFRMRVRGRSARAEAAIEAVIEREPLQLFAYGEGMMVASDLGDVEGVERWIERARAAYPRRVDLIATFAERAWRSMGEHARAADALRSMRLGGPFVTAETRTAVDDLILHLDAEAAGSQPDTSPP